MADDPIAARASLPADLLAYIRRRQKQLAPLCPSCGVRKVQDKKTGWCNPCAELQRARENDRKLRWWENYGAGVCPMCGAELRDVRRHLRKVHGAR